MKFAYGQRVIITKEGFYKGVRGVVMRWTKNFEVHGGDEWYSVMLMPPDGLSAVRDRDPWEAFTESDMELAP